MSTIVLILALLFTSLVAVALLWWFKYRSASSVPLSFIKPTHRTLAPEERVAVENYLLNLPGSSTSNTLPSFDPKALQGHNNASTELALTPDSDNVYAVTRAITRYGVASDEPNKWRYYLDSVEIHLPPFWEPFIAQDNFVEIIQTNTVPLVISLNGHSLKDYTLEIPFPQVAPSSLQNASIRKEDSEHIELVNIRKETPEEHALYGPNGLTQAATICVALLLLFLSLISPAVVLPWLILVAIALISWACWHLFRPLSANDLKEVHCLSGTPKRWGLFGESNQNQMNNISLGIIDLIYPAHWLPYFTHDLGKKTNVDIYLNRQVIRQGRYLSLHDEMKNFPLQHWGKNLTLMLGSLTILILLLTYIPLSLPLKLSMAWIQGAQTQQVTSVLALEKMPLRIGDMLKARGTGMCYVPPSTMSQHNLAFTPFDCSSIYWNTASPLPQPESEIIEKAAALVETVHQQLHPQESNDANVNPKLATAIEKSGMTLLDDFADIVLKTNELCRNESDCGRLKNALVNLGNAKNWAALTKRAQSGALQGMNVLLRPVSADALERLVKTAASSFVYRETHLATEALNSPPPGGFLISSDEGKQLVSHPIPSIPLFDYTALEQWRELQRLSGLLLNTPFKAEGVITSITVDANGTRHITLHSEPDVITLSRYLGTTLLLFALIACLAVNGYLVLVRMRKNRTRLVDIQRYYDHCFDTPLSPPSYLR
ncbi:intracellular growth attenuator IgaA family protein [Yersinia ruckeri]|uniref:intracellular growth attenuator family protein n=1 Tax=Yersinia ruckeri TaxID=29486 RepID=UPI0005ABCA04|nr:intracellular growth attenuator family protein [Yersinia ruckeri]AJI96030.1 intracellular growth attenuator IgaA family protein [Yersinia ruckeri]